MKEEIIELRKKQEALEKQIEEKDKQTLTNNHNKIMALQERIAKMIDIRTELRGRATELKQGVADTYYDGKRLHVVAYDGEQGLMFGYKINEDATSYYVSIIVTESSIYYEKDDCILSIYDVIDDWYDETRDMFLEIQKKFLALFENFMYTIYNYFNDQIVSMQENIKKLEAELKEVE